MFRQSQDRVAPIIGTVSKKPASLSFEFLPAYLTMFLSFVPVFSLLQEHEKRTRNAFLVSFVDGSKKACVPIETLIVNTYYIK